MRVEDIEIHDGEPDQDYKTLGQVRARVTAATVFSKTPTIEDVNDKLREQALKVGANAILGVKYQRGVTATSWKGLTATGTAVILESDERPCPFCAENIKAAAIKCRFCGADVAPTIVDAPPAPLPATSAPWRARPGGDTPLK